MNMFIKKKHNIGISLYSFISQNKANHCQTANHYTLYPYAYKAESFYMFACLSVA